MMWVVEAAGGRGCKAGTGKVPVCVDRMISAFGIWTRTPGCAGAMLAVMSWGGEKCPVAPVSSTKVGDGEADSV